MRGRPLALSLSLAIGALLAGGAANSAPITYTESATISGSLDGAAFSDALITITGTSDTTTVFNDGLFRNDVTASFLISGTGSGNFTDVIQVFANQGKIAAGFDDFTLGQSSILDTFNAAFGSYDLTTAIGPLVGSPFINSGFAFGTSAGDLIITASSDSTFTAVVSNVANVPEPASLMLVSGGLMGIVFGRRRRRA